MKVMQTITITFNGQFLWSVERKHDLVAIHFRTYIAGKRTNIHCLQITVVQLNPDIHFSGKVELYHRSLRIGIHVHLNFILIQIQPLFRSGLTDFNRKIIIMHPVIHAFWYRINHNFSHNCWTYQTESG